MATVRYEAFTKNGTYKDSNGQEKNRWFRMGVCFQNDKGQLSIKVDGVPVNWDGWISLMEPKPKDGAKPAPAPAQADSGIADDDIPF
jgi:hypothetical protein